MNERSHNSTYRYYYISTWLLSFAGVLVTCYLSWSHYRNHTELTYASFCAISRAINCDTVSQSPWSVIGDLPVAIWGLFAYLFFIIVLRPLSKNEHAKFPFWKILFFLSGLYSLTSLFFAYISLTKIHSFCVVCILSYAINFSLLFITWLICRRLHVSSFFPNIKNSFSLLLSSRELFISLPLLCGIFFLVKLFLPHYWEYNTISTSANIATGITHNGHPWIGAENPTLTIEEYSDYQCFQCFKMQYTLRQFIAEHPDKIRLIHRHYPMDHEFNPTVVPTPFHVGSGKMSLLAIYAISKGKFWEMNDALFQLGRTKTPFNTRYLAKQTKIPASELSLALSNPDVQKRLNYDILTGMKKRITATPSFLINNKVYTGFIPPEILEDAIRQ